VSSSGNACAHACACVCVCVCGVCVCGCVCGVCVDVCVCVISDQIMGQGLVQLACSGDNYRVGRLYM